MGYSQGTFNLYNGLFRAGHLPCAPKILDFGSENLFGDIDLAVLREFVGHAAPDRSHSDAFLRGLIRDHGKVADLFSQGQYLALDMYEDPRGKTRKFDLNFDSLREGENGTFDLVGNLGTTEHVANQFNCFKVLHDGVKVGGVMFHYVPFWGGINHGLVKYEPKFFTTLIANNGYEALDWYFTHLYFDEEHGDRDRFRDIGQAHGGAQWEGKHHGFGDMIILCRKVRDAPFVPPTDFVEYGDAAIGFPSVNDILLRNPAFRAGQAQRLVEDWKTRSARVVLYGAGLSARALARSTCLMEGPIVGVVDSDTEVQGTTFMNMRITGPETIPSLRPDVILVTSLRAADEIVRSLRPCADQGIEIIRFF